MKIRRFLAAATIFLASATAGSAATYNWGDVIGGASSKNILTKKTVDFIDFTLDASKGFYVSGLDIFVSSNAGSNSRPIIGLYSGTALVASNDSGTSGGTATLSFSGARVPAVGVYTLGIGAWKSNFTADMANAKSTAYFNNGEYNVSINPTISAVPLPAGGLLLLTGLGALALKRRKNRNA